VEANILDFQLNYNAQQEALLIFTYKDGTTVKEHLSSDTYDLLVNYLKKMNLIHHYMIYIVQLFLAL